ncbi:unnamed protein product, partial [Urochloa humidicola]
TTSSRRRAWRRGEAEPEAAAARVAAADLHRIRYRRPAPPLSAAIPVPVSMGHAATAGEPRRPSPVTTAMRPRGQHGLAGDGRASAGLVGGKRMRSPHPAARRAAAAGPAPALLVACVAGGRGRGRGCGTRRRTIRVRCQRGEGEARGVVLLRVPASSPMR